MLLIEVALAVVIPRKQFSTGRIIAFDGRSFFMYSFLMTAQIFLQGEAWIATRWLLALKSPVMVFKMLVEFIAVGKYALASKALVLRTLLLALGLECSTRWALEIDVFFRGLGLKLPKGGSVFCLVLRRL